MSAQKHAKLYEVLDAFAADDPVIPGRVGRVPLPSFNAKVRRYFQAVAKAGADTRGITIRTRTVKSGRAATLLIMLEGDDVWVGKCVPSAESDLQP